MFFTYLGRELRRRSRQALVIALGLALGIGLTITVSAYSAGVKAAQTQVLKSLYGVGTDITVTQTATRGSGGDQTFGAQGQSQTGSGTKTTSVSQDTARVTPGTGTIAGATLTKIQKLSGVSGAVGSLSLSDFNVSGALKQSVTQVPDSQSTSGAGRYNGGGGGGGSFQAGPPSFSGSFSQTTIEGVDVTDSSIGPLSSLSLSSGRALAASDAKAKVAVVNKSYATQKSIKVGSTQTLGGTKFTVVGIVSTTSSEDYFIPLYEAQTISDNANKVTTVYVKAASSTQIDSVASSIKKTASGSTVSTSAQLASSVSGSLSSAGSLIVNLGKWLSIAVLAAAFLVAVLFTVSAVSRRTREFGTLKAIGWTSRRVVRQVIGESIVTGIVGGALGVGIGFAGAAAIKKFAPTLTASGTTSNASNTNGGSFPGGGNAPGGGAANTANDIVVHLGAPVSLGILGLAVALAVLGGLLAGGIGGWRASSLRPADALSKVA
ncbi:ABC transporter permease [Actinospica robiniae]|uniref:ABC transporter permease n=1 Tax=Actinospica robiniae TaxID=304901 RepID=UPI0004017460|nr:ABC transporter permease [Actinospica robiniae]